MSTYETLTLMIAFAMLVAVVINGQKNQLTVVNSFYYIIISVLIKYNSKSFHFYGIITLK
nr:putative holin-like toxin [Sedimentibacter sp.]